MQHFNIWLCRTSFENHQIILEKNNLKNLHFFVLWRDVRHDESFKSYLLVISFGLKEASWFCSHLSFPVNTSEYKAIHVKPGCCCCKHVRSAWRAQYVWATLPFLGSHLYCMTESFFLSNTDDKMNVGPSAEVARAKYGNTSSPSPFKQPNEKLYWHN